MSEWIKRFCLCGATLKTRSTPPELAQQLADAFDARHAGEGCGPATPRQAARARAKTESVGDMEVSS